MMLKIGDRQFINTEHIVEMYPDESEEHLVICMTTHREKRDYWAVAFDSPEFQTLRAWLEKNSFQERG